ncbi:MAG TPA: hypothetical protein VKB75_15230, partial [Jatrophihabitans sp.]|nr:hypothetical protein [Jatrophihabitans sp.]
MTQLSIFAADCSGMPRVHGPTSPMTRSHLIAVSTTLAAQAEALDVLLFRLDVVQLLLLTGSRRWLARAREDVDAAVDVVQLGEVLRAAHAEDLAARLG